MDRIYWHFYGQEFVLLSVLNNLQSCKIAQKGQKDALETRHLVTIFLRTSQSITAFPDACKLLCVPDITLKIE